MSLLTIIQNVCNSPGVGLAVPTVVVTSADAGILELLQLANQEGKELGKRFDWPVLTAEQTFTTTAAAVQVGAIPSAFDRFVNDSMFNRTTARKVVGPISPQQWQAIQANGSYTSVIQSFRRRGTDLLITPTPAAGETIAYEYISKNWCESSGGTDQSAWVADTDVGLLDEELMKLGIIWRWRKAKGFSFQDALDTYNSEVEKAAGRAPGAPTLYLNSRPTTALRRPLIPEGSWS
jgi:hypothetical protein